MRIFVLAFALACSFAAGLPAQDNAELLNRMKAMEDRIKALEAQVQSLEAALTAAAPGPTPIAAPAPTPATSEPLGAEQTAVAAPQLGGAGPAAAKALNPDIALIGDFVGAAGNPGDRYTPSLEMHESEVALQEVIDPYARADVFFSFGEQGVGLEEGYLTFTSLPAGLQIKAGKMRAAFGKVNTLHNHSLPWVDRPLVTQNLLGGEEGINDAGLSVSRILPSPEGVFMEATAQVYRGDTEGVFRAAKHTDLAAVGHLRIYKDLTENTNLDLGGSFSRGHSPFGDGWNQLYGFDGTLRWKPLQRAIYHSFVARTELVWARTAAATGIDPVSLASHNFIRSPFGFYASGEYQFGRRWFAGARFDRSQRVCGLPTAPETTSECAPGLFGSLLQDTGGSLVLTYWPSEFTQIRGQLRRTSYGGGYLANELLFQFVFSMGAHGAHPF